MMKTNVFIGIAFTLLSGALIIGCGHHKRHKSVYHITNCTQPCATADTHGHHDNQGHHDNSHRHHDHDCHEGHDD
jgi:hypothetical protein